jgi:hypothetical protein
MVAPSQLMRISTRYVRAWLGAFFASRCRARFYSLAETVNEDYGRPLEVMLMKKERKPNATGSLRELEADALEKVVGGYIMLVGLSVPTDSERTINTAEPTY